MPFIYKTSPPKSLRVATIERVIRVLLIVVFAGAVYRYCWKDYNDPFKCAALLNKGQWLDEGSRWRSPKPFQHWQPPGCTMHEYERDDIKNCFQKRRIVFIGDSTTRQIYWAVARKLDSRRAEKEFMATLDLEPVQQQKALEFVSDGVTVRFIWDPWLNSTRLDYELREFRPDPLKSPIEEDEYEDSAGVILLGAPGLWNARHGGKNYMKNFKEAIDHVVPYMDHPREPEQDGFSTSTRFTSRLTPPNLLLLAPVQDPLYTALTPSREATITPEKIDQMNDFLQQASANSQADVVWSYSLMTWASRAAYEESGLHVISSVARQRADVLLNLRCNVATAATGYAFDGTCCTHYSPVDGTQSFLILMGLIVLPGLALLHRKHIAKVSQSLPTAENLSALATLGLVLCYCFYADRSQLFEKALPYLQSKEFWGGCTAIAIYGVSSIRKIGTAAPSSTKIPHEFQEQSFLSRNQTDEWKGWMQLLILLCNYTEGETKLWIYELLRLFVASYLFMTGFGHTLYFLNREDYSFSRVATVLVRRNMFSLMLAYMMRTDYTFYYFAPVTSLWFLITYVTFGIGHRRNHSLGFLLAKLCVSIVFTVVIMKVSSILESISNILKYTSRVSIDVPEFRALFSLDMYIAFVGVLLGIFYHRVACLKSGSMNTTTRLNRFIYILTIKHSRLFRIVFITLAIILLPGYWILTRLSPDEDDYNWWQPYITFIPILSFVVLRNSNCFFRAYYSKAFARIGKISLELYLLQHHVWLAGDGQSILRLGLLHPWIETVVLVEIMFWVCWKTANATRLLTNWIVRPEIPSTKQVEETSLALHDLAGEESASMAYLEYPATTGREGTLSRLWARAASTLGRRLALMVMALWVVNMTYG
ncbi:10 TM acyl transferase domain found in Cas1p-domain-containing protein [Xylogone sp. PMI_703]|nr:10 TM acyl transferase domain found in Cas1p-domain-containing protein [Xylogone sp. PMI_703]